MKSTWMRCTGFLLVAGCSGMSASSDLASSGSNRTALLDGFWCDLTGTPATFTLGRLPRNELPAYPRYCLPGNHQVPTAKLCQTLGKPCYQLDTGSWCSGEGAFQSPKPYL